MFKLLVKYLKPYVLVVLAIFILVAAQSDSELMLPDQLAKVVGLIGQGEEVVNKMLGHGGIALAYAAGATVCAVIFGFLASRTANAFGRDLREQVFKKVQGFSLAEFDKIGTSSLITRTTNDITQIVNVMVMMLRMIISVPIMMGGGIIMAVGKNARLTAVLAGSIPALVILILAIMVVAMPLFMSMQKRIDKLTLVAREGITGVRVIRAFNKNETQNKKFQEANWDVAKNAIKVNRIMSVMMPLVMFIFYMTTIALYYVAALNADSLIYLANLTAVIQYCMRIMMSVMMLAMLFIFIPRASASAKRIREVLETDETIKDKENPASLSQSEKHGELAFNDVTFYFPGAEEPSVSNVSFSGRKGETVAIIGGTGSGKSTIINLAERFYDVSSGSITLDGTDIRDITQKELRDKIGFVPQAATLFSGTIKDNIKFGSPDLTDGEVAEAARIAQAADFIEKLPEKYDAPVAQGGTNFSGGQKQRLSMARAIAKKPEVFIFDDSFSALDFKTDAKLRKALSLITKQSLVLIVAQRISTIMNADKILVVEHGKIVGSGTHGELLKTCPTYAEIANSQLNLKEGVTA
jgi:ATP-binding cassette subfamily B protein